MADLHGTSILQLSRPLIKHNGWTNIQDCRIIAPLHTASAGNELKRSFDIIEHSGLSLLYLMAPRTRILISKWCSCTSVMFVLCINKCHWFQSIFELCSSQNDQNINPGKETEERIELKRPNEQLGIHILLASSNIRPQHVWQSSRY